MSGTFFRLGVCVVFLCSVSSPLESATEEFLYDHLGNRYQVAAKDGFTYTYTHNLNNQYTHIHGEYVWGLTEDAYPEYDDNGNLQTDKWGRQHYYDYRNRLIEIGNEVQYGYDALGRRVSKYDGENNLTTYFYYDAFGRVIAEYEKPDGGDEAFARSFVYGNGIDEVLAMFLPEKSFDPNDVIELAAFCEDWLTSNATYDYDSSGVVDFNDFAVLADGSWSLPTTKETHFYYLKDALGSVIGIVGGKFQRVSDREFYLYDVYGKPSDASVPSAAGNPYFFTGRRRDPESGLYYFRARTYDPETGRFLQTDPIGYADSMNLYEYVVSNPVNCVDPYGLWTYKGMYDAFGRKYGEKGYLLLTLAEAQGYVPVKRDYWLHDWYYESDGTLGIASWWSDWSGALRLWEDSDETAADQLYDALRDKYGRLAGRVMKCLCKLTPTYNWTRQVSEDATGFFEQAGMSSLGEEMISMEAQASMLGSHLQNEAVAEANWAMAAFIGGHVAGKALDALDDCLDARRIAKAADKADDLASAKRYITPRNASLAGKKHPVTDVAFDAHGYPDFRASGRVKTEVKISQTGSRPGDFGAANRAAGYKKTPEGFTWHHHQDGTTMQLVPSDIHAKTGHTGGFSQ